MKTRKENTELKLLVLLLNNSFKDQVTVIIYITVDIMLLKYSFSQQ